MYPEPEDRIPKPDQATPRKRKGRRLAVLVIPAVVALIVGFTIGRLSAPSGSTVRVLVTQTASPLITVPVPSTTASSASASPSASSSASSTSSSTAAADGDSASSTASPTGTLLPEYLSDATIISGGDSVNSPVDATISGTDYPNSIQQAAEGDSGTTSVWDSAQYGTFTAVVGIDDSQPADGQTARIVFMNQSAVQLGTAQVSIGAPTHVSVALNGAIHLEIQVTSVDSDGGYLVTFGNAQLQP